MKWSFYDRDKEEPQDQWAIEILIGGLVFRKFVYSWELISLVECLESYKGPIWIRPW